MFYSTLLHQSFLSPDFKKISQKFHLQNFLTQIKLVTKWLKFLTDILLKV